MFAKFIVNPSLLRSSTIARRSFSSVPSTLYNKVWRKSNVLYITYVAAGCVIIEVVYGTLTNFIWDSYNYGVRCHYYLLIFVIIIY